MTIKTTLIYRQFKKSAKCKITLDIDKSVKQSDWSDFEEVWEILHADFEWITVVEL